MIFHQTLFIPHVSFKNVQKINQLHEQDPKSCSSWSIWEANVFFVNVNVSELLRKVLVASTNHSYVRSVGSLLVLTASVRPELYQTENVHTRDRNECLWEQTVWTLLLQVSVVLLSACVLSACYYLSDQLSVTVESHQHSTQTNGPRLIPVLFCWKKRLVDKTQGNLTTNL